MEASVPGVTEAEVAAEAIAQVVRAGGALYGLGLSSGPWAHTFSLSTPAPYGGRGLEAGDMIRLDLYGSFEGYLFDFGRSRVVGRVPTQEQQEILDAVKRSRLRSGPKSPPMSAPNVLACQPVAERPACRREARVAASMTSSSFATGGCIVVMGIKERRFDPLPHEISLEDLVPQDNFYRRLETALDLSFVRDMVRPLYARGGRPSVDPVVFFRLQLVMFFEGLRSERELMRVAADRLSVRWYLGYDLHEPLPDHSNLTRTRERFGLSIFRRFFEEIVQMCVEAGLVRGEDLYFDATKVDANA